MKRKLGIVISLFFIIAMTANVYAANPTVSVTGDDFTYPQNFEVDFGYTSRSARGHATLMLVDGDMVPNTETVISDGTAMVPLRVVSEKLGASTIWNPNDKSIKLTKGSVNIVVYVDKNYMYVNGRSVKINKAPQVILATTFVPLRAIAEGFGAQVGYSTLYDNSPISFIYVNTRKDSVKISQQKAIEITGDVYFNKFLPTMYDYIMANNYVNDPYINIRGLNINNIKSYRDDMLPYPLQGCNPRVYADLGEYYYVKLFNTSIDGCFVDKYNGSYYPVSAFSLNCLNITQGNDFGSWGLNYQ